MSSDVQSPEYCTLNQLSSREASLHAFVKDAHALILHFATHCARPSCGAIAYWRSYRRTYEFLLCDACKERENPSNKVVELPHAARLRRVLSQLGVK